MLVREVLQPLWPCAIPATFRVMGRAGGPLAQPFGSSVAFLKLWDGWLREDLFLGHWSFSTAKDADFAGKLVDVLLGRNRFGWRLARV